MPEDQTSPMRRFEDLISKLAAVPKRELDRKRASEKRKPRRPAPSR